jgi:hypothetical protein
MSFIFENDELIDLLLRQGLGVSKLGQAVGVSPQDFAALRGLVDNLEQQIATQGDPNAPAQVATEDGQSVSLISPHLENLGTLVEFLARNKITVGGKRVAYAVNDMDDQDKSKDQSYPLYKLQGAAGLLEPANRNEAVTYGYYINNDLLKSYISTLQAQLVKNPNPVLQAQVKALVQDANEQLDANISATYQEPAKTLRPDQLLDNVPQNFSSQSPTTEGNVPLTFADISSDTGFNAWIQKNNIGIDGRAYKHPEYNKCALIKALYSRSQSYLSNSTSAEQKNTYTIALQQLPQLANAFKCDLGQSNQPGTPNMQGGQQGAGTPQQQVAMIGQLVSALPLRMDVIDFAAIRDFINTYKSTVMASRDTHRTQQAAMAMQQAEQYMQAATQNTVGQSMISFKMNGLTALDLVSWATPPGAGEAARNRGSAVALADYLEYVVRSMVTLITDLYMSHADVLAREPQLQQAVEQQAGGNHIPYGSSIAASNISNIRSARSRLPQVGAK